MTNYAVQIFGPLPGTTQAVSSSSTSAVSLSGYIRVMMRTDQPIYIRFGNASVGACTTSDMILEANLPYVFDISPGTNNFRALRVSSDATLRYAKVQ